MHRTRHSGAVALITIMGVVASASALTPPASPPRPPAEPREPRDTPPAPSPAPCPAPMPGDVPPGVPPAGPPGAPGAPGAPDIPGMPRMPEITPPKPPPPMPVARYTLPEVAFMAGRWRGATEGSAVEEHWSAPEGTSMVGMFRWVAPGGAPYMFQLMTLTEEGVGVIMRVREFSADLVAREEKDKPKVLRLIELKGEHAEFAPEDPSDGIARVIYERTTPDTLAFTVTFPEEAKRDPFKLELAREGSASTAQPAPAPAPAAPGAAPPR